MQRIPNPTDRRVVRTRQTLRTALIALIEERGWDAIEVSDICERANVGRSTFYTHFGDKEELLLSGFADLRAMLVAFRPALRPKDVVLSFSAPLLQHAHENRGLFRALVGKRAGLVVQRHFRELVVDLTAEELADQRLATPLPPIVRYIAGGFFELVGWWLDAPGSSHPAEVDALFQRLTAQVLAAARGTDSTGVSAELGPARRLPVAPR